MTNEIALLCVIILLVPGSQLLNHARYYLLSFFFVEGVGEGGGGASGRKLLFSLVLESNLGNTITDKRLGTVVQFQSFLTYAKLTFARD